MLSRELVRARLNLEGDLESDLLRPLTEEASTSTWWTCVGLGTVSVPPLLLENDMLVGWRSLSVLFCCVVYRFFSFLGFAVKIQRAERRNVGVSSQQAMNQSILGGQANCRWVLVVGILFRWLLRVGGGGAKVRSMDGDRACRFESSRGLVVGLWRVCCLAYTGTCWRIEEMRTTRAQLPEARAEVCIVDVSGSYPKAVVDRTEETCGSPSGGSSYTWLRR